MTPTRGSLTITGARVWDGTRNGFGERDLAIVDGLVTGRAAPGAETLDGSGCWVLPGLVDAHFHAYATAWTAWRTSGGR